VMEVVSLRTSEVVSLRTSPRAGSLFHTTVGLLFHILTRVTGLFFCFSPSVQKGTEKAS
jgi:hypothetical protein